jgi:hypothetical protein
MPSVVVLVGCFLVLLGRVILSRFYHDAIDGVLLRLASHASLGGALFSGCLFF